MPLSIRNPRAEALARELAARTGERMTEAIIHALEERLERLEDRAQPTSLVDDILAISDECSRLSDLDPRPADELLDGDEDGTLG